MTQSLTLTLSYEGVREKEFPLLETHRYPYLPCLDTEGGL